MADTPNDAAPPPDATAELDALRARLAAAEEDLHNHKLQLSEHVNARKRLLRDAEVEKKYSAEPLARDLLGALDNLDRALQAAKAAGDTGPLAVGVAATADQILAALARHGITRIPCEPGVAFDPNRHEAVSQQPAAGFEAGQVVLVLQQGFLLHDRVLRPATVVVASPQ